MRIGILSDTHDRPDAMAAAMKVLRRHGAEFYIHCGDVGGQRVLDHLAGCPAAFVWGNNDWDRPTLARYASAIGVACHDDLAELNLGGKSIAVIHGDDFHLRQRLLTEQRHDYLLQGHTHFPSDQRLGRIRLINPGALHRAREKTVAMLDTDADAVNFLRASDGSTIQLNQM